MPPRPLAVEREAAFERIKTAYADEVISYDEMTQRLDGVLTAATGDEVVAAIAGLPTVVEDRTLEITAISGRIKRLGAWRVPRRIRITSEYGQVKLDLSQARFESDAVEIDLQLRYGQARILVPRSAAGGRARAVGSGRSHAPPERCAHTSAWTTRRGSGVH